MYIWEQVFEISSVVRAQPELPSYSQAPAGFPCGPYHTSNTAQKLFVEGGLYAN